MGACEESNAPIVVACSVSIDHDHRVPVGITVEPSRLLLLDIDAAVATVVRKARVATGVGMWKLRTRSIIRSPPGIVYVITTSVIHDRVMDGRIRIPVRRAFGFRGFEDCWRFAI